MSKFSVTVNGKSYHVTLLELDTNKVKINIEGCISEVLVQPVSEQTPADARTSPVRKKTNSQSAYKAEAPMPGIISKVLCTVGDVVDSNTPLVIIEAMKMENPISLPNPVVVKEIHVSPGEEVLKGHLLVTCAPPSE